MLSVKNTSFNQKKKISIETLERAKKLKWFIEEKSGKILIYTVQVLMTTLGPSQKKEFAWYKWSKFSPINH